MKYARQEYVDKLPPKLARKIFHIRTGTIDLRGVREYRYGENTLCRLCHAEDETVEHVVNNCNELERTRQIDNIFTTECGELKEMAVRCIAFDDKLEEINTSNIGSA